MHVQIIRDVTHAYVIIRGSNGHGTVALCKRDIAPDSPRVRKLVRGVARRERRPT